MHRPRYDDWSLPKGKLARGEDPMHAALREVAEETGVRAVLGRRLPAQEYTLGPDRKTVDYWEISLNVGDAVLDRQAGSSTAQAAPPSTAVAAGVGEKDVAALVAVRRRARLGVPDAPRPSDRRVRRARTSDARQAARQAHR